MARIDRYIEVLFERHADRLVLATGEKVALVRGDESQPITTSGPPTKALEDLLGEIVPDGLAAEIRQDGEHGFPYAAPTGVVVVTVRRAADILQIEMVPSDGGGPPPAESPQDPVPAAEAVGRAPDSGQAGASGVSSHSPSVNSGVSASGGTAAIDALFHEMVGEGCSDLHMSSECMPFFRKDGSMVTLSQKELISADRMREMLFSITPPHRQEEFQERHDTDFSYEIAGLGRFRCNLFMDRKGIGGVFRIIPVEILSAEKLGLSSHILELCKLNKGLVVVTGPTGSGKSTTLAAMVDHINETRADHLITIEDPIEFVHPNKKCLINQREIGDHTDGFKPALRAALREDPDIVLVGEMRDLETVEIAIETAETGHLVFGTLHTNTAPSTVDRIIDQFPSDRQGQVRTMLSDSLKGVIAQTLCKKKGGGRIAALETLIVTPAVSNLIREGKTFQIASVMQTGKKLGMTTLNDSLLELVTKDLVEPGEAYAKAAARAEFLTLLKAKGIALPAGLE